MTTLISRAQGCLLGQLAGDSLGSLVEFQSPGAIQRDYPEGVRELANGGMWNTLAGQPTDDSEMALLLARCLAGNGRYDPAKAREAYEWWLASGPFDAGMTVSAALRGQPNPESQSNGALMRVSPLGVFGARHGLVQTAEWARQDALITHVNPICLQVNALYAMAIAHAVRAGAEPREVYDRVREWAAELEVEPALRETVDHAADGPPPDFLDRQGWVLIAFRNAFWRLVDAPDLESGVVDTVMCGGDTDTNAAICGALLGSVHGREAIPTQWEQAVLNCRPSADNPRVKRPRPERLWPTDALELAETLATGGANTTE
ncbi:MAG: ADP-ribosylglycohydrolase family protein [Candidatus Hydrogenedentota bacterium]